MDCQSIFSSKEFISALVGAIVGGFITGFFSLKATEKGFENQKEHTTNSENESIKCLLQAIHDEVETVYERYQETMGARLESLPANQALAVYYPVISEYFSVYNNNTFLISRIKENDLRKLIIKTYTLCKGMADSLRLNNDLTNKFEFAHKIWQETQQEIHRQQREAHLASLIEYANTLKQSHLRLKNEINLLLRELRKRGVLSEQTATS